MHTSVCPRKESRQRPGLWTGGGSSEWLKAEVQPLTDYPPTTPSNALRGTSSQTVFSPPPLPHIRTLWPVSYIQIPPQERVSQIKWKAGCEGALDQGGPREFRPLLPARSVGLRGPAGASVPWVCDNQGPPVASLARISAPTLR